MESPGFSVPAALLGQAVLFVIFILVVSTFLKEAARIVIRIALVVGAVFAVALIAGWLEQTTVARWLAWVGDAVLVGLRALVLWLKAAWETIAGAAGSGG